MIKQIMREDYKYIDNNVIDVSTGEIVPVYTVTVPYGSKIITPKQQEIINEKKKHNAFYRYSRDELGDFYFLLNENKLGRLSATTTARLIYLCTFIDYTGKFMLRKKPMSKNDIQNLLRLSKSTFYNFWKEINPSYIIEDENGLLINTPEIYKGKLKKSKISYRKIWINQIRNLYEKIQCGYKNIGYVFLLLPYINIEFNILCWNPAEKNLDNIKPIIISELCGLIGYNPNQSSRLINNYRRITFEFQNEQEYLVSFVTNNGFIDNAKIFVNPHILYSGSNYKKVEILGAFGK